MGAAKHMRRVQMAGGCGHLINAPDTSLVTKRAYCPKCGGSTSVTVVDPNRKCEACGCKLNSWNAGPKCGPCDNTERRRREAE